MGLHGESRLALLIQTILTFKGSLVSLSSFNRVVVPSGIRTLNLQENALPLFRHRVAQLSQSGSTPFAGWPRFPIPNKVDTKEHSVVKPWVRTPAQA